MSCLHGAMIERMTRSNPAAASSLEWPLSARRARSCPPHEHQPATRHRPVPARTADGGDADARLHPLRSEEHTSELQPLMRTSYAVFCLKKKNHIDMNITRPSHDRVQFKIFMHIVQLRTQT